jgi:hypothetical protein
VVRFKDRARDEIERLNATIERELPPLASSVERRREELAMLKRRLGEARAAAAAEAAHGAAISEIAALRSSASWRITAPLRALYDVFLGVRKGGGA